MKDQGTLSLGAGLSSPAEAAPAALLPHRQKKKKGQSKKKGLKIGSIYFTSTFTNSCWLFTIISPCSAGVEPDYPPQAANSP